jgi:hypothetical protein
MNKDLLIRTRIYFLILGLRAAKYSFPNLNRELFKKEFFGKDSSFKSYIQIYIGYVISVNDVFNCIFKFFKQIKAIKTMKPNDKEIK